MFMLCGNPDLVVERGENLIYCAGAIAELYVTLGGEVLFAGRLGDYRYYDMHQAVARAHALFRNSIVAGHEVPQQRRAAARAAARTA
jgi:ribonucleotide monophosphatase NagD (HAD superfamily)